MTLPFANGIFKFPELSNSSGLACQTFQKEKEKTNDIYIVHLDFSLWFELKQCALLKKTIVNKFSYKWRKYNVMNLKLKYFLIFHYTSY